MNHLNIVEFQVSGDYALFSDPIMRIGGEKCSYQIPTYEALKGILSSVLWKPTIIWVIDRVRIMNPIQTESKGVRLLLHRGKEGKNSDLAYYTYLKNCVYQVQAHFDWNTNRPQFAGDQNPNKYYEMTKRMIQKGGRRDIFLGTRECQGYVEPCIFGQGVGAYDDIPEMSFGLQYHGLTYADEAYSEDTRNKMTANFWYPVMKNGIITFPHPKNCPLHKPLREMEMKIFDNKLENFSGPREFGEVK